MKIGGLILFFAGAMAALGLWIGIRLPGFGSSHDVRYLLGTPGSIVTALSVSVLGLIVALLPVRRL